MRGVGAGWGSAREREAGEEAGLPQATWRGAGDVGLGWGQAAIRT